VLDFSVTCQSGLEAQLLLSRWGAYVSWFSSSDRVQAIVFIFIKCAF
jgi:hypothetical protein